ncbi:Uncharacterised protein [Vibrio cholerae]|nr:Uncharacterised protein [Vibrio cholerae]
MIFGHSKPALLTQYVAGCHESPDSPATLGECGRCLLIHSPKVSLPLVQNSHAGSALNVRHPALSIHVVNHRYKDQSRLQMLMPILQSR